MKELDNSPKVKLRIDLPNEKKPFFNRVTTINNALSKVLDAEKLLKKNESLNLKFNGQEKTVSKLELKDFSMEKLLDMLPKAESKDIAQEVQQEPKFNAVVALFDVSQDNPKLESKQDFVNLNFEGVLDVLAENEVFKSMQKDENSFSSRYQEEMEATRSGFDLEDVIDDVSVSKKEDLSQSNYNYKFQVKSDNGFETTMILNSDFNVDLAQINLKVQYSKFNEEKNLKNEIRQIIDKLTEPQKQSFDFLSNHLKYLGFGEKNLPMQLDLAKKIQSNENDFSIKHVSDKGYFKTNNITFDINFHKSKNSDKIFLNSYDVNLKNNAKGQDISHNFNVSKFGFTQKEAVNLIEGRSVKTDLKLQNGETEKNVFIRLDFSEKESNGNFKTKKFFEGYGVNTDNILQKNSAYFKDADVKDKVIKSLEKGNVVPVLFKNGAGKTQSLNAILSPESKSLQLYNNRMERVNITETLSNSAKVEQSETKQHISQHTNKLKP